MTLASSTGMTWIAARLLAALMLASSPTADEFAAAVFDGHPPRVTREDSIGNMRVLDEMRRQIGLEF